MNLPPSFPAHPVDPARSADPMQPADYSDPALARALSRELAGVCRGLRETCFMEVCGTHTMAIFRHGLRSLLPENLTLISGPGCPVCVTPTLYLDQAQALAGREDVTLASFGDLIRVPGSHSNLERAKAEGADVRIVYSPLDALTLAQELAPQGRIVVFLAVGFETTSPAVAQAVLEADRRGIENFRVLVAHRRVVPALEALLEFPDLQLDGFLLPGHVSVILGAEAYRFLEGRRVSGVVAGFEPVDVLAALLTLVRCARDRRPAVVNQYARLVRAAGNPRAREALELVFAPVDAEWRGLGTIPSSGHALAPAFARFDALSLLSDARRREIERSVREDEGCRCGEVLCGVIRPPECELFGVVCTPETAVGPCMVSSEGTCAAYYKYGER